MHHLAFVYFEWYVAALGCSVDVLENSGLTLEQTCSANMKMVKDLLQLPFPVVLLGVSFEGHWVLGNFRLLRAAICPS